MGLPSGVGYAKASVTPPGSDLTDPTLYVDLSALPSDWWTGSDTSDESKMRAAIWNGTTETEVPFEAVDYVDSGSSGSGELYCKWSGTLSTSGTQEVRIYPPQSSLPAYVVTDTFGRNNVWTGFDAVWHMEEDPSGAAPQLIDSTGNGNDGTSAGSMTSGDLVAGKVGSSIDFDGSDDAFDIGTDSTLDIGTSDFYLSCWLNHNSPSQRQGIMAKRDASDAEQFFWSIGNTSGDGHTKQGLWIDNSPDHVWVFSTSSVPGSAWHHIAVSADRSSNASFYLDGAADGTPSISSMDGKDITTPDPGHIGSGDENVASTIVHVSGNIDELRFTKQTRSADWVKHHYDNQSDPSTFWGTWSWVPAVTLDVSGAVTGPAATAAASIVSGRDVSGAVTSSSVAVAGGVGVNVTEIFNIIGLTASYSDKISVTANYSDKIGLTANYTDKIDLTAETA